MKKTLLVLIGAATLLASATLSQARPWYHGVPASQIYISGHHRCGTPIYTERFFVRYDRWGRPVWGYRTVSAPPRRWYPPHHPPVWYDEPSACPPPPPVCVQPIYPPRSSRTIITFHGHWDH